MRDSTILYEVRIAKAGLRPVVIMRTPDREQALACYKRNGNHWPTVFTVKRPRR